MDQEMTRTGGARRLLRDLLPITLAAGAAALAVTLVVGGTTAELTAPEQTPPWPVGTDPAPDLPGEVTTRSAAPRVPRIVATLPSGSDLVELALGPLDAFLDVTDVQSAAASRPVPAAASPVTAPVPEPVAAVEPVLLAAPVVTAPSAAAPTTVVATSGKSGKPKPLKPAKPAKTTTTSTVSVASAAGGDDAPPSNANGTGEDEGRGAADANGDGPGNNGRGHAWGRQNGNAWGRDR